MGSTTSKNLGLIAAVLRSASAPANHDVIWLDISGSQMLRKVWNPFSNVWELLTSSGGSGGDNWGTQVVETSTELDGDGTIDVPLKIAQQGATTGQVLKWDGDSWSPADDNIGNGLEIVTSDGVVFQGDGTVANPLALKARPDVEDGYVLKWNKETQKWLTAPDNVGAQFSRGMILMWSGAIGSVPVGWRLCDGNNGVPVNGVQIPNLSGQFIVGYSATDTDYNAIGKTGGAKNVTLNTSQIPSHSHGVNDPGHSHNVSGHFASIGDDNNNTLLAAGSAVATSVSKTNITIQNTGGGAAHENRPPYYTLAYIIYIA